MEKMQIDYADEMLETRFGRTHIVVAGKDNAPPVVLFHGGNSPTPHTLKYFLLLRDKLKLQAPDPAAHRETRERRRLPMMVS